MYSQRDSKKWKGILLAIDLVLLAVAICAGVYCLYCYNAVKNAPNASYEATMQQLDSQEKTLDEQIEAAYRDLDIRMENAVAAREEAAQKLAVEKENYIQCSEEYAVLEAKLDEYETVIHGTEELRGSIEELRTEYGQAVRKLEDMILAGESEYRICYLTFDDGPSYYTERFLDQLDELDVYVTFFTIGVQMGKSESSFKYRDELLRRQMSSGHSIANHTYTHAINTGLYSSLSNFTDAVEKQDEVVYNATGFHTEIVRFPAGSYYCPFRKSALSYLEENGFGWIDWSGNAYDSGNTSYSAAQTASIVIGQVRQEQISVVLMHDWKLQTLGALETIVTTLKAENYVFLPLFKESSTIGTVYPKWD